ncbi:MAG: site-2 protease family protein, partial [Flavipsychrobacter sp.]
KILKSQKGGLIQPRVPAVIGGIAPNSMAERLKLRVDDSIVAVNGKHINYFDEFNTAKKANYGKPLTIEVVRGGGQLMVVTTIIPKDSLLGIVPEDGARYFAMQKTHYNPIQAIGKGVSYTWEQFGFYWKQFKMILTSKEVKPSESLGGVVSFGKMFSPVFNMHDFLTLTAFVSIILAFMNLLPIPGLDGGYVIFLLFELLTGKKVSEKVMERATTVGLVLLLGLMLYANGLDIFRLFKK